MSPYMVNQTQDGFSIMRLQRTFFFFSALFALGMTSFVCRIGWNGFFLEITSIGNFLVKKSEKNAFRKVPILAFLWSKNRGVKKWA